MGELEPALDYYHQAIGVIEELRAGVSAEAAQAGFFATVVDTYANMALLYLTANHPEQAFNIIERARSRTFLDSLAARSPELAEQVQQRERVAVPTITLAEVQAHLSPDTLLLEYFTTGLVEAREGQAAAQPTERHRFPQPRTLLFAVTHNELQVHDIGLSPNDLRPRQLNSVVERHFLQPQIRRSLYDRLIAPVEPLLQGKRRIYLVPHGPLHYIPFQALLAPDGEPLLRENGPQLVYAPSGTLLFRYGRIEAYQALAPCLALGYNGQADTQLRFAEEEAYNVARLTGGRALVGPASKKPTLYQQASTYRRLHFSCHGEFDPDTPLASALHLGPDETITALDVLDHLRLQQCDLVTLSACESGLSRVRRGDELVGLTRAFMYAGAPALISTLWQVDERSTRILMEKFYHEVHNGLDFAEALKQAQLYLKRLTRRDVFDLLVHAAATADDGVGPAAPPDAHRAAPLRAGITFQQARTYLKGLANQSGPDETVLPGETDEDHIFADPFYWAPFILIV
jgi:CHAT domain-containing protein